MCTSSIETTRPINLSGMNERKYSRNNSIFPLQTMLGRAKYLIIGSTHSFDNVFTKGNNQPPHTYLVEQKWQDHPSAVPPISFQAQLPKVH